ncbi:MAG: hypothetical protein OHK0046_43510 [Anaerolineae bacterium]
MFLDYLRKLGFELEPRFVQAALGLLADGLMEMDVSQRIDAGYYERNEERVAYRNGYRERTWKTRIGDVRVRIPKLRRGTYNPGFLDERLEARLLAFIEQAYLGLSHLADFEDLLLDLNLAPTDAYSDLYVQLETLIERQRQRPFRHAHYAHLWLDTVEIRIEGAYRTRHALAVVAVGMRADGRYDVLDFDLDAHPQDAAFWHGFLRRLARRGLRDVQLVISEAHNGIKTAVHEEMDKAEWQYSYTRPLQELLNRLPESEMPLVDAVSTLLVKTYPNHTSQAPTNALTHDLLLHLEAAPAWLPQMLTLLRIKQSMGTLVEAIGQPLMPDEGIPYAELAFSPYGHHPLVVTA